ncbi:hypothetical protein SFRURICE_009918 [Spodoptera frugiperda]|nr:hypothetical protein SFRURICE_009918 [Spodoptera frugiperda]
MKYTLSGAVGATNGCASRNKIGALGEVRFKTVALRGIPHSNSMPSTQLNNPSNRQPCIAYDCNDNTLTRCVSVDITARNGTIQCTPTFHHLCYKSHLHQNFLDILVFSSNTMGILGLSTGCVYKYTRSHTHDTQTRIHNLGNTQRVALCGNRPCFTLYDSRFSSQRTKTCSQN